MVSNAWFMLKHTRKVYVRKVYVRNFGNNNTSKLLLSTNTATLLEVNKHVEKAWGLDFGISLAGDFGSQFGNQFGVMLTIRKQGIITQW